MKEQLENQVYFIYEKDIEYLLAAVELLKPQHLNPKIKECYDEAFVEDLKRKYPLLYEIYGNMSAGYGLQMLDFLLDYEQMKFSLEGYFAYLKGLEKAVFLSRFLDEPREEVKKMLSSEEEAVLFYQKNGTHFQSYYVVDVLLHKTEWFLDSYAGFVAELKTERAEKYLSEKEAVILEEKKRIETGVKQKGALPHAEAIMGKSFYHRGPFQIYYFMPSLFLPIRSCRWYGENQFLIYDVFRGTDRESVQMAEVLKVMSDATRYRILTLLKERKHLNGSELAELLKLSTPTISHHMSQLKNCGLIHEEPAGNTKYYSINEPSIRNCIETLEKTFL